MAVFLPARKELFHFRRRKSLDFLGTETVGLVVKNVLQLISEGIDHRLGCFRTDAGEEATAEIGGEVLVACFYNFEVNRLELLSEFWVPSPLAFESERFYDRKFWKCSRDDDDLLGATINNPQDGESVLRTVKGNRLDGSFENHAIYRALGTLPSSNSGFQWSGL